MFSPPSSRSNSPYASASPSFSAASSREANASASLEGAKLPTLERLVSHFVTSKRSLQATSYVSRANEMVTTGRTLVSESAVLGAKNGFVRAGVDEQIAALRGVRSGLKKVEEGGMEEFQAVLKDLDAADARLKVTMDLLRTTIVEASFRPDTDTAQSLYDFVDDRGVNDLNVTLRECIDRTNEAYAEVKESNATFDNSLDTISSTLSALTARATNDTKHEELDSESTEQASAVHFLCQSLEEHATEMAALLQSLVEHYDLCVSALKHTEGGLGAATQAAGDLPAASPGIEVDSLQPDGSDPGPLSDEERLEMMAVLDNDAAEVEDVVTEIRERAAEMEAHLQDLIDHVEGLKTEFHRVKELIETLGAVGNKVGTFVNAGARFMERWDQEKRIIGEKMEELASVRDFYEGFLAAYDGLIIEIERRRVMKARMKKVADEAMTKIERLYQEEVEEREAFRLDQGEYLPSDIWPDLVNPPARFEISEVDKGGGDIPTVSDQASNTAKRRTNGRP